MTNQQNVVQIRTYIVDVITYNFYNCSVNHDLPPQYMELLIYCKVISFEFYVTKQHKDYEKNLHTNIFYHNHKFFNCPNYSKFFSCRRVYRWSNLTDNANWGGQYFYINTTNESVSTQSNVAEAYWGQSQTITEGETITFEVDMKFGGDLNYTTGTLIAQIGFNAGGTTSSGGSDRQFIYLKALTDGRLKITNRNGTELTSTPSYSQGKIIPTFKNEDLTVKVSFLIG